MILGCDCSSFSIGCTLIDKNEITLFTIEGGRKNDFDDRVRIIFKNFKKVLEKYAPEAVFLEGAIYLQNVKTTLMIARVIDMAIANCIDKDIYYQIVDNKSWKKDILGNGKSTKEQIMNFAKAKWGDIFDNNQDLADSALIAFYGLRRLKG